MTTDGTGDPRDALAAAVDAWSASVRRNDELAVRLEELERMGHLIDDLLRLLLASASVSALLATLADRFAGEASWIDLSGRRSGAEHAGAAGAVAELASMAIAEPNQVVVDSGGGVRYAVAPASDGRLVGVLVMARQGRLSADALDAFLRAAQIVGGVRLRENALRHAYEDLRTDLLTELLSVRGRLTRPVRVLAEARGLELAARHIVVAVDGQAPLDQTVGDVADLLGGVGGRYGGSVVAVVPGEDPKATATSVADRLRHLAGTAPAVCASDAVDLVSGDLPDAFEAARHGLALQRELGTAPRCVTTQELSLYRLLFDPDRGDNLQALLDDVLRPLLEYEREHKTDLVQTVRVFLAVNGNMTQAARRLFIHPNTMAMRLDRVSRLLGQGWQDGVVGLRLRMALHLLSLKTVDGEPTA